MEKPNNISFEELVKSTSSFFVDAAFEKSINEEIEKIIASLEALNQHDLKTKQGIKNCIKNDENSLSNILTLLDVSEERFKRIISMMRRERKYVFSSEWSLKKTRSVLLDNDSFMNDVCELLLNGSESDKFKRRIPDFYRESFQINKSIINRLKSHDELRRIAKHQIDVKYNTGVAKAVNKKIEDAIKLTCDLEGLTYEKDKPVIAGKKCFNFVIPNRNNPRIVIDSSYNITTSSSQSNRSRALISSFDEAKNAHKDLVTIQIIEGSGWIARQSDLNYIYDNTDYTLNLSNIGMLDRIIRYAMEESENEC